MITDQAPSVVTREIVTLPVRTAATTWTMAEHLILDTLEALGFEDRDAIERGLGHLAPLLTYLIAARGLARDEVHLDCGRLSLQVRFVYDETDSSRDDVGLPLLVAEPEPGASPTLAITTSKPMDVDAFLPFAERAEGEGRLRVDIRHEDDGRGDWGEPDEESSTSNEHLEEHP